MLHTASRMKYFILLGLTALLTQCATPSDPTFMTVNSAAIHGGVVVTPDGPMAFSGVQNRNRVHPFFGAP